MSTESDLGMNGGANRCPMNLIQVLKNPGRLPDIKLRKSKQFEKLKLLDRIESKNSFIYPECILNYVN